jgi:hypothetical protein
MLKKIFIILLTITLLNTNIFAQNYYESLWTYVLQQYVKPGEKENISTNLIDYPGLSKSKFFQDILDELTTFEIMELKTKEQEMAFWINAYNIAAVKVIIENYPLKSIEELNSWLIFSVFDKEIIKINQKYYSLNAINEILKKFNEPLLHFALCNTQLSSPDIRPEAYTESKIYLQLRQQANLFLQNNTKGFLIDEKAKKIYISRLFQRYENDFVALGGPKAFIQTYLDKNISTYTVEFLPFNGNLNNFDKTNNKKLVYNK